MFIQCSGGSDDNDLKGYLQEESIVPDYDNDPIYSKANARNLPSFWDIFVESAAMYGKDLSDISHEKIIQALGRIGRNSIQKN